MYLEPSVPCFDWTRPSFGGKTKDNGFQVCTYIYIYIIYLFISVVSTYIT